MTKTMTTAAVLAVVLLGGVKVASAETNAERFQRAGKALACKKWPDVKKIKLNNHKFNMDDEMYVSGGRVHGEFSHHLTWRPDDEISFSFVANSDDPSDIKIEINRGGFFGWIDDLVDGTIGTFFGLIEIQPDDTISPLVVEMVDELAGRRWEDQAAGVVMVARALWVVDHEAPERGICDLP